MKDLYPAGPALVPPGLIDASKAYRRHAWLAVAGLLAFVALYLCLTVWFAYRAYWLFVHAYSVGSFLGFAAAVVAAFLAVFLGKALFFIRHHEDPTRFEITESQQPQLFAFVRRLADEARAPRPHRVFVSPRVNAAVFYDLSLLNLVLPSRKNLEIGLGLVHALTLGELKAVLAHEFGHFAQRSMAVGRWVYVGQQIAGHIVGKRDILDRFLLGLSRFDLRVAWIGWAMRLVVWSIRSVTDSFFRMVIRAELALSREMELQADKVAVSLTGSDALVHALFKLPKADDAFGHAESVAMGELRAGRRVPDLFALQGRAMGHLRRVIGEEGYGELPPLPSAARHEHRLFTAELAQPPSMWSTHPPNHLREANAKQPYVPAELDDRPAWIVFADGEELRARATEHRLKAVPGYAEATPGSPEQALATMDGRFEKRHLDPRYHGLYLGRAVTRDARHAHQLYGATPPDVAALHAAIAELYPARTAEVVRHARDLDGEKSQLQGLADGLLEASGGVISHRGRTLRRRDLGRVIAEVTAELTEARRALAGIDAHVRTTSWAAATACGQGWPEYLRGLAALLHYAEHGEADVDDAMGHLANVTAIVTADGRVSGRERRRVLASALDLQGALDRVWIARHQVTLPPAVSAAMEVASWADALGETFQLPPPNEAILGDFMEVVDSWFVVYSQALAELRWAALAELLQAEDWVCRAFGEGLDPGPAPAPAHTPEQYATLLVGEERERQRRLGWWDRFVTADGFVPGSARFAVATGVVGAVVAYGGAIGAPTVVVHNGLQREVVVTIGEADATVPALGRAELTFVAGPEVAIETRSADGRVIETFAAPASNPLATYAYSVGGASPLVRWTATYGDRREQPPVHLGARRWLETSEDVLFEEPPAEVSTKSGGAVREVLSAIDLEGDQLLSTMVGLAGSDERRERMSQVHARFDAPELAAAWLMAVSDPAARLEILRARVEDAPDSVALGRLEQDWAASPTEKQRVCERHRVRAVARAEDPDARYLALRCLPDGDEQDEAMLSLHQEHPQHPWLNMAAGFILFGRGELEGSLERFAQARAALGPWAEHLVGVEARIRRMVGGAEAPSELAALLERSTELRYLQGLEVETPDLPASRAYRLLHEGELAEAVVAAPADERPRVLRLAAASRGASAGLVDEARALPSEAGLDHDTVFAALIVARARGDDDAAIVARIDEVYEDDAAEILRFADGPTLSSDLDAAERALRRLHPEAQGHAAVLGVRTLGDQAPAGWREAARRLLFAAERPYL